jgi:hypothetical protein
MKKQWTEKKTKRKNERTNLRVEDTMGDDDNVARRCRLAISVHQDWLDKLCHARMDQSSPQSGCFIRPHLQLFGTRSDSVPSPSRSRSRSFGVISF